MGKLIVLCFVLLVSGCAGQAVSPTALQNADGVVQATIIADQATISVLQGRNDAKGVQQATAIMAALQTVDGNLKAAIASKTVVTSSDLLGMAASAVLSYTMFLQQEAANNGK